MILQGIGNPDLLGTLATKVEKDARLDGAALYHVFETMGRRKERKKALTVLVLEILSHHQLVESFSHCGV
jgi:hypothetical protein